MLVFIDESGDPGFKVDRGSAPIFAAAMVIFDDREAARQTELIIKQAMADLKVAPEFKFNKSRDAVRDGFFAAVTRCPFRARAIVVRKEVIHSDRLRTHKDEFYRFFVKNMVKHDGGALSDAKIIIDGSGEKLFRRDLERHLKQQAGGGVRSVKFAESHRDVLVQLADMVVGAVARSYRPERRNHDRWRNQLGRKLEDVWEFR